MDKKSLSARAATIDFSDLGNASGKTEGDGAPSVPPVPRLRSGVEAINRSVSIQQELQSAKARLKDFEEAKIVVPIDPNRVRESPWKNRDPRSFETASFLELKEKIRASGGNEQAVKVRRVGSDDKGDLYEIVWGRRRTQACRELGYPVNAVIEDLTDAQAFRQMHGENLDRDDLSPWEQGLMYKDAVDQKIFGSGSMRQTAEALGVNQGNMTVAIKLANLPADVVAAFTSPLELQFRWAAPLADALQADPARVLRLAEQIVKESPRPPAKLVFERLTGLAKEKPVARDFRVGKKLVGTWVRDEQGAITMKLKAGVLTKEQAKEAQDFIASLLG